MATVALALWPTSFVLWAFYSEGLFITATALGLWADRRDRPAVGVVACFLTPLTRTVGWVFGPVLAAARWWRLGRIDQVGVSYLVSGAAGAGVVTTVQQVQTGDPLAWVHAQEPWGREPSLPWSPVTAAFRDMIAKLPQPALELAVNLGAVGLAATGVVVLIIWWRRGRLPMAVAAWSAAACLVPLCSAVISSQVRFALGAWPALVAWSHGGRWGPPVRVAAALAGLVLSILFVRRWAGATWVA